MANEFAGRKNVSASKSARRAGMQAERIKVKRLAAKERQDVCDKLSVMDRIARLDRKLGVNQGACKERARLLAKLEAQNTKVSQEEQKPQPSKKEKVVRAPKKNSRERAGLKREQNK